MVWAIAIPTLPVPMMEIFIVCRFVGDGGAASWIGAKKDPAMSRPIRELPDGVFGIDIFEELSFDANEMQRWI